MIFQSDTFSLGSLFLGCGGGQEFLYTRHIFDSMQDRDIDFELVPNIRDDAVVCLVSFCGSSAIESEIGYNSGILLCGDFFKIKFDYLTCLSFSGNIPYLSFCIAQKNNLPMLNADYMGRCFSRITMFSTNYYDIPISEAIIFCFNGDSLIINSKSYQDVERYVRSIVLSSGGHVMILFPKITGKQAKQSLILNTFSKCIEIGEIIEQRQDWEELEDYTKGTLVGVGRITSIDGLTTPKPYRLKFTFKKYRSNTVWNLYMANEYDLLLEDGHCIAEVPDIIALCHPKTLRPYFTKDLYEGLDVAIFKMPAPDIWYTERGLSLVRSKEHVLQRQKLCA